MICRRNERIAAVCLGALGQRCSRLSLAASGALVGAAKVTARLVCPPGSAVMKGIVVSNGNCP